MKILALELPDNVDFISSYGAGVIAGHIVKYWKARGFHGITAERYEIKGAHTLASPGDPIWGVRSNIGPLGWPPR